MTDEDHVADKRPVKKRIAARVLLVDPKDRVLLIHCHDIKNHDHRFWVTPGGGVDKGESYADAAIREAFEETGLVLSSVGDAVHERDTLLDFFEVQYQQHEQYFFVRVDAAFDPSDRANWTDIEHESILGFRWWAIGDLEITEDLIFPEELPELLRRLC